MRMGSKMSKVNKESGSKRRRKVNKSNMSRVSPKAGNMIEVGGGNVQLSKIDPKKLTGAVLSPRPETSYNQ